MTTYAGREAVVEGRAASSGAYTIFGEVRGWTVNVAQDTIDATASNPGQPGDGFMRHIKTFRGWDGTFDVLHDPDQASENLLVADLLRVGNLRTQGANPPGDTRLRVQFYTQPQDTPGTPISGDQLIYGIVTITGGSITSTHDGLVEANYTFLGQGDLSVGPVP